MNFIIYSCAFTFAKHVYEQIRHFNWPRDFILGFITDVSQEVKKKYKYK